MKMANNKKESDENGGFRIMSKRRSTVEVDHWAFLEEVEAPMWADLTLEPNMAALDNDDAWFHTSHSFHHLSARQLISAFAHPDVETDFVKFNLHGVCSPKLPSSVSKSRGKDYINKPWRNNDTISVSKSHPVNDLGGRSSRLDIAPSHDSKPRASPNDHSEVTDPVTSVQSSDSHSTSISCTSQVVADGKDTYCFSNSQSASTSGLSTSTTTVSQRYDTKPSEGFGMTGGLLNALKTNLRRSYATRPALRVEMCDDRELKGRKSSSSKSSVGSSSVGYDGKVKRSTTPTKTDHLHQVKMDIDVNIKHKGQRSLTGKHTSMSISNSMFEGKKIAADIKQNKDKYLGVIGPETLVRSMKGRVINNNVNKAPVQKLAASLKPKGHRNSNVRDLGKSAPTLEERAKFQKQAEASAKTRPCYSSRIGGGGAVAASTRLQAVTSKVPISDKVKKFSRLGVPAATGKVGRVHLNRPCSSKENVKKGSLESNIFWQLQHTCCKNNRSGEAYKVVREQRQCSICWVKG